MNKKKILASAWVLSMLAIMPLFLEGASAATVTPTTPLGYTYIGKTTVDFNSLNNAVCNWVVSGIASGAGTTCGLYALATAPAAGSGGAICAIGVFAITTAQGFVCWLTSYALSNHYNAIYFYRRAWWNPFGPSVIAILGH